MMCQAQDFLTWFPYPWRSLQSRYEEIECSGAAQSKHVFVTILNYLEFHIAWLGLHLSFQCDASFNLRPGLRPL